MKKLLLNIIKIAVPLALGLFLIWYIYKDLSQEDKSHIFTSFKTANYGWLLLSIVIGIFSHISRAYRWNILLKPMGFEPKLYNGFFAVMTGYLANMAFPRLGEVSRAAVFTKYEKVPFEKAFGTIMAERVIDMFILLSLTLFTIITQFHLLGGFLMDEVLNPLSKKFAGNITSKVIIAGCAISFVLLVYYIIKSKSKLIGEKLGNLFNGFLEGFKTVLKIERKAAFIFHSLLIWVLYFLMLWVCFFTLPETSNAGLGAVLAAFVFGSFGIIAVQGGIGAYPAILTKTLALYGIATPFAFAVGWIAWTGQSLMILIAGVSSIVLLPLVNKKRIDNEQSEHLKVQDISA
ncbi:MAG: flippase-like domain-containing protein [Bacteroidetes bacterium]|nr:flippase-like domain-containing protein [Bacteroidota bacterium]